VRNDKFLDERKQSIGGERESSDKNRPCEGNRVVVVRQTFDQESSKASESYVSGDRCRGDDLKSCGANPANN
jgi:hypothetical protein